MRYRLKKGYSLLELSISLAIIATILAAGFSMINGSSVLAKRKDTEKRMKIIEKAIASYAAIYDRIPCPADLNLADNNSNSGIENCCYNCANLPSYLVSSPPSSPTNFTGNNQYYTVGTVPYVTLGLPKEYLADAWANKFIYSATLALAGKISTNTYGTPSIANLNYLETANMGLITVIDSQATIRTNNAAYMLMSAGNNGLGAYPRGSITHVANLPSNANELINYNSTFATGTGVFVAYEQTSTYDDIIHYKQKWQIVKEAGLLLSNQTCALAKTLMETADINSNSVNYSPVCSYNQLDTRCSIFASNFILKIRELCLNQF
jgi:prepilin-type N-terminal cleavage/methylation domain-containing protein